MFKKSLLAITFVAGIHIAFAQTAATAVPSSSTSNPAVAVKAENQDPATRHQAALEAAVRSQFNLSNGVFNVPLGQESFVETIRAENKAKQ